MKRKIKPTFMGWHLIGLIFALLLLSVSYSNNLLLIVTLLFLSFSIMWASESFYKNRGLSLIDLSLVDFFADESKYLNLPSGVSYILGVKTKRFPIIDGQLSGMKRGYLFFDSITIKSELPFGFFEYQETSKIGQGVYIYPRRIPGLSSLNESVNADESDLMGLTRYQQENPNRIHWKHYAKTHELVSKEFEESQGPDLIIEITSNPTEESLSAAAFEIHYAFKNNKKFVLKLDQDEISDYTEALQRLALC